MAKKNGIKIGGNVTNSQVAETISGPVPGTVRPMRLLLKQLSEASVAKDETRVRTALIRITAQMQEDVPKSTPEDPAFTIDDLRDIPQDLLDALLVGGIVYVMQQVGNS